MTNQHSKQGGQHNCDFCEQMREESKRYYPRTFRWRCPESNLSFVIEWSETTDAKRKLRSEILSKMADGTFGTEVQEGFIEGTKGMIGN